MNIDIFKKNNFIVLTVNGDIDVTSIDTLDRKIKEYLFLQEKDVLVDINGLQFINSVGMAVIGYYAVKAQEDDKYFALINLNKKMSKFLAENGIEGMVEIYPDAETAFHSIETAKGERQ